MHAIFMLHNASTGVQIRARYHLNQECTEIRNHQDQFLLERKN
jgi:hypothetical protein